MAFIPVLQCFTVTRVYTVSLSIIPVCLIVFWYAWVCLCVCVVLCAAFTKRAHIVRAMLEAICWQTREVLDAMQRDRGADSGLAVLRVDGGASKNDLLMQMQVSCCYTDSAGRLLVLLESASACVPAVLVYREICAM